MQSQVITFEFVIQADLESLSERCYSIDANDARHEALAVFYGRLLIDFLRGDLESLQQAMIIARETFATHDENSFLACACELRADIRGGHTSVELMKRAEGLIAETSVQAKKWRGELAMLVATAHTISNDYATALTLFQLATRSLASEGFLRKSLRAQMNVIVCESHLFPKKNLFARYHDLYRQAVKPGARETIVATTCLLNISREYQTAGANLAALKYCNRALTLFERQMGDLNYYLTLLHRARLLISLGRMTEARIDLEAAQMAAFTEVQKAVTEIETQLAQKDLGERASASPALSQLEEKLLSLLARGPRDRIEIVDEIYGERLDHETKQNRFKSLVGTFRKKHPDLIVFESGRYRLADEIVKPQKPRVI